MRPDSLITVFVMIIVSAILVEEGAQAQEKGFYSIDCGSTESSSYTDETTGIVWTPDSSIMTEGVAVTVKDSAPYAESGKRFSSLRYFPTTNHSKYCYKLSPVDAGDGYIVRAYFWIASTGADLYPSGTDIVSFKFIVDSYVVANVSVGLPQTYVKFVEMYVVANTSDIYACVASGGQDAPFITSIELRPLPSTTSYGVVVEELRQPLSLIARANMGGVGTIRYPDDQLDRIWYSIDPGSSISTTNSIKTKSTELTPMKVMQTSWAPNAGVGEKATIYMPVSSVEHLYFVFLHFAEISSNVSGPGERVFDVGVTSMGTSVVLASSIDIYALAGGSFVQYELMNYTAGGDGWLNITLSPVATSLYSPSIAAIEIIQALDFTIPVGTHPSDVLAMESFTNGLSSLSSYTGDPCLPKGYAYPWLNCSYGVVTRINSLRLSNSGLAGEVPSTINNLTELNSISLNGNNLNGTIPYLGSLANLEVLDLSNNQLIGSIPDFLSTLASLKVLNLENNNLSGPIPSALLEKNGLEFKYSGNLNLCTADSTSCTSSTASSTSSSHSPTHVVIVIAVVIPLLVVVAALIMLAICCCKRNSTALSSQVDVVNAQDLDVVVNKSHTFSYKEIIEATNGFTQVLGQGGFGSVYKGALKDGCAVAVKVLSTSGDQGQGLNEFKNEATLLSTVHHKNIVQLLGFCVEVKLALVYELMPNGSLYSAIFGAHSYLSWTQRLTIMIDVAQGMEYLHHQCVKQIIHRDVKSSNILLDDNLHGKIADLGISKDNDGTTQLMGSFGYLDPEYAQTLCLTKMVDVYSYGVVLFEVITERPPILRTDEGNDVRLVDWVKPHVSSGNLDQLVDKTLRYNQNAMWSVIDVAVNCTKFNSSERPQTMGEIVSCLRGALQIESVENGNDWTGSFISTIPFTDAQIVAR